jgi:hypothetical protein
MGRNSRIPDGDISRQAQLRRNPTDNGPLCAGKAGGIVQHVLNRGNGRMKLFNKKADYQAFVDLLGEALDRVPGVSLLGWCLMPNHWHLVPLPTATCRNSCGGWPTRTCGGSGGTGIRSGKGTSTRAGTKTFSCRMTGTI